MPFFSRPESGTYTPLHPSESSEEESKPGIELVGRRGWSTTALILLLLISIMASGTIGFILGDREQHFLRASSVEGLGAVS